ncbi:MAG: permease [Actinomycetota bacterium]
MTTLQQELLDPAGTRRGASWRTLLLVGGALVAGAMLVRAADPDRIAWIQNLLLVFSSLLIEALPFVLLGALVSAAIEVFVPASAFEKLARLPRGLQLPAAGFAGMAFPVCECGSVPVARRLASKGLSPGAAITFMLAAPVVNPVVVASTFVAYRGRSTLWPMVLGRLGLGLVVAIAVGWVVGHVKREELLRARAGDTGHDHGDDHDPGHAHGDGPALAEPRWSRFAGHVSGDFLFMAKFLAAGALAAAALQTFVPQSIIGSVANLPIVSLIAMMALAFLLSLCSESDAFVAASFVQFGVGPQLAFLVFGPMVDMKLGALYVGTFNRGFFRTITIAVAAVTLVATLWIEVLIG